MSVQRKTVFFRIDSCQMTLNLPEAVTGMTVGKLRKFFRYALQPCWDYEQEEVNRYSAQQFFECIPDVLDDLWHQWSEECIRFKDAYEDEKFDRHGYVRTKKDAQDTKRKNKHEYEKVTSAKKRYEAFEKKAKALEQLKKEIFGEEEK